MPRKGGKAKRWKAIAISAFVLLMIAAVVGGFYMFSVDDGGVKDKVDSLLDKKNDPTKTEFQCDSSTTPQINIKAYDSENKGTSLTEATNIYRKKGSVSWSTFTAGTAFPSSSSLEIGQVYEYVMGITTSDFTDNAYGEYGTFKVGCDELAEIDKPMFNDEVETSLSATFYNSNHDASAETFTAGEVNNVYLKWKAGSDEVCGNPFLKDSDLADLGSHSKDKPNVICLNLNKTVWDSPDSVSVNGVKMDRVSTPIRHSVGSTDTAYCFEAPVITDVDTEFVVNLDADDSTAPGNDGTAYLYCGNFYVNKEGNVAWGIEDEEGNAVGTDAADSLTLDFTA